MKTSNNSEQLFLQCVHQRKYRKHISIWGQTFPGIIVRYIVHQKNVLQKLKCLKINKSPGPDCHHPHVLKEVAEVADPLTSVLNKILSTGNLSQLWKDVNVTPIFKRGEKSSPGKYRPVNLISVICKLMESLVCDHMLNIWTVMVSSPNTSMVSWKDGHVQQIY